MAEITAKFEHKEGNEIRQLPVHVTDVDEMFIWMMIVAGPTETWNIAVPWSKVVEDYLPPAVKELLKSKPVDPQPEEVT